MALTKKQKETLTFIVQGFEKAADVRIRKDGMETDDNSKNIGVTEIDIGDRYCGECYWVSGVKDRIKTNFSLAKYTDSRCKVSLRFKPESEDVPRIKIKFDSVDVCVGSLIKDFSWATNFVTNVGENAYRRIYNRDETVSSALIENFPADKRYLRYTKRTHQATYVGKFHNKFSGIYLTVPSAGLAGPQFIEMRKLVDLADKTLEKLIKAAK